MKNCRALLLGAVAGIAAVAVSSCAYDPYYSGSSYSAGYGDGYGYGGSNFSTSFFVRTSSPRWGYDPHVRCYYDYNRRAYYDPYLAGYYPVGYRPRYIRGAPHPHDWRHGHDRIAPPNRIRSYDLKNYRDRGERYRSLGRDWSRDVIISTHGRNDPRSRFGHDQRHDSGRAHHSGFDRSGIDRDRSFGRERDNTRRQREIFSARNRYDGQRGHSTGNHRGPSQSASRMTDRRQAGFDAMRNRQPDASSFRSRRSAPERQSAAPQRIESRRVEARGRDRGGRDSSDRGERARRGVRGLGEG